MLQPPVPLRRPTTGARILVLRDGPPAERPDRLANEEPMEIRAHGPGQEPVSVSVTMRTLGHDFELAVGFLFTEGLIDGTGDVGAVAYCEDVPTDEQHYNIVTVALTRPFDGSALRRTFYATSGCGICGKASLGHVSVTCAPLGPGPVVPRSAIAAMPDALRASQRVFEETGGLHAAGLFTVEGEPVLVREDVGRHNAVDKLVGRSVLDATVPLTNRILFVSGRVSFEIVQKAAVAGIPLVAAVSAPSSLAVEAASALGMTVAGFVRGRGFNVYAHPERVAPQG